jgi:hypothetical protein
MSRGPRRYYRTLAIGLFALGVLLWAAVEHFGVSYREIGELFLGTFWVVTGIIVLAAVFSGVWIGLRRWLRRRDT